MMVFILMVVAAWVFVALAVRTGRATRERDSVTESIAIHRDRLARLDEDHRQGELALEDYRQFKAETERALLEDTRKESSGSDQRSMPLAVAGLTLVTTAVAAFLLYDLWGAADAVEVRRGFVELTTAEAPSEEQLNQTLDGYQRMLERRPEDAEGWFRLANMQMELGRYEQAQPSLERVLRLVREGQRNARDEATILAYLGQTLWAQEQPDAALARFEEALQFNAQNTLALGFAGRLSFERGDHRAAIDYWHRLKDLAEGADTRLIDDFIERSRAALADQGIDYQPASRPRIQVDVTLPSAWEGLPDSAALFVYARRPGETAPLVVKRVPVAAGEHQVTLTDADAMGPMGGLAGGGEVEVTARVSLQGRAEPAPGDWTAEAVRLDLDDDPRQSLALRPRQP